MTDLAPPAEQAKIVRIVDVETSGLPEDENRAICEIGWVDLDLSTRLFRNPTTFLVNPGHPIPPHIRAVHHISDSDVSGAMPVEQALALLMKGLSPDDVLAAHKAEFEQNFIPRAGRWICTWKISLRAWPNFVSHSNQALRYELDIDSDPDFDPAVAMPPHRALPDAIVTAHILRKQLELRPLERLVKISGEPGFLTTFGFGKHKGKTFKEVAATDRSYLTWIVDTSDLDQHVKFTARFWLERSSAVEEGRRAVEESRYLAEQGSR